MAKKLLIPQYSIRWLMAVTLVCAIVFSIFATARQEYLAGYGEDDSFWATGVSVAILSLVLVLVIHAMMFAAVWVFAQVTALFGRRRTHRDRVGEEP